MKIKADLHNHLRTLSGMDGLFNQTANKTYQKLGPNGVLGLINFLDVRYESFVKQPGYERINIGNAIYVPEKNIWIVKGQEVPTKQGHLLVLGLNENKHLKDFRTLEDSIKESRDNNGIIIADHPFYAYGIGNYLEKNQFLLEYLDGIEIHNGGANVWIPKIAPANANQKAQEFYEKIKDDYDIGAISVSDGHSLSEIGSSYIFIDKLSFETSEELNESLRKSIREHKILEEDKQTNSNLRSIDHIGKLGLLAVGKKLGIKLNFENKNLQNQQNNSNN